MDVLLLLGKLRQLGIELHLEGGELKVKASQGVLTSSLIAEIRQHKSSLLELLTAREENQDKFPVAEMADSYPVSFAQRGIWLLSQHADGSRAYNIPLVIRLSQNVVPDILSDVLKELVQRHEALRTAFFEDEYGIVRQRICNVPFEMEIREQEGSIDAIIAEEGMQVFDLMKPPLIRAALIKGTEAHFLLLTIHHIVFDGFSGAIFQQELFTLYEQRSKGLQPALPRLVNTYKDFAVWEQQAVNSKTWEAQLAYWKGQLQGTLPMLQLSPGPRPAIRTNHGSRLYFTIDSTIRDALASICKVNRASLFSGLLAGLNTLFYRYTGAEDLLVGVVLTGREHIALQALVGMFVNTLPMRTPLAGDKDFVTAVTRQQLLLDEMMANQQLPLSYLVEKLNVRQDTSHSAIFDVMVVYNEAGSSQAVEIEKDFTLLQRDLRSTSQFDLSFSFTASDDSLALCIEFNTDIYTAEFVEQLGKHYIQLLKGATTHIHSPLKQLDYLNREEKDRLLHIFNKKPEAPVEKTLISLFIEQVRLQPEHIALRFNEESFSFAELDKLSSQLAAYLSHRYSLQPEQLICVSLLRNEWLIISLLAVLKNGCAYVPVDPNYPQQRKDYIIANSQAALIIDEQLINDFKQVRDRFEEIFPVANSAGDQLAYVIYTSGSTGNPKGCMVENRSVINRLSWLWHHYGLNSHDIMLQKTSFTFDVSVGEIFTPLCFGCQMVLCDEEAVYLPERIAALIQRHKITIAHFVPGMLQRFIAAQLSTSEKVAAISSLRRVFCSGEALLPNMVDSWYERVQIPVSNLYGPTEAAIEVSYYDTKPGDKVIPIGKPIANNTLYILDNALQLLPIGVAGELCIGGVQLARGYQHNPQQTAERFVPDPFSERPDGRLYRTGDLARWLPDGNIEYLGRIDNQVKIRGYRIELEEIEYSLSQQEGVTAAAVTVHQTVGGEQLIIGFVVGRKTLDARSLREGLSGSLPEYMLPAGIVQIDSIPITTSGKIDRKSLPVSLFLENDSSLDYVAPENETEFKLSQIWQEVLKKETPVSITTDFFHAGGHSLLLMQVGNMCYRILGVKLNIQELFRNTTIRQQSQLIREKAGTEDDIIPQVLVAADYPVSDGQKRLWLICQQEKAEPAYHMPGQIELDAGYDIVRLGKAIELVINSHEILRTVFVENAAGELRQVVRPATTYDLSQHYLDMSHHSATDVEAFLLKQVQMPFDLERGPLIRTGFIRKAQNSHLLWFNVHHIIFDGVSMELLKKEILQIYDQLAREAQYIPTTLPVQYKDYAYWQQELLHAGKLNRHRDYWLQQLAAPIPVINLPIAGRRPSLFTFEGAALSMTIRRELVSELKQVCREEHSTLFMGLTSVLYALIFKYTREEDIIIGTPVSGRLHPALQQQIGFYVNTIALRNRTSGTDSFRTLLRKVREAAISGYEHQDHPFDRLLEDIELTRDMSRSPLFDIMLILHNEQEMNSTNDYNIPAEGITSFEGNCYVKFDLNFDISEVGEQLYIRLSYNRDIYTREVISRFLLHFQGLLQSLVSAPDIPLDETVYMAPEEEKQLLEVYNHVAAVVPKAEETLVQLFNRQIHHGNIALYDHGKAITYETLSHKSDHVAQRIQERRGRTDTCVLVCMERSFDLLISLLGILKTGATYIPVDPANADDRIAYIIKDAAPLMILTDDPERLSGISNIPVFSPAAILEEAAPINIDFLKTAPPAADPISCIIYTSGSTGYPKGVMIRETSIINRLYWMWERYPFETGERSAWKTAIGFVDHIWEIFGPLLRGIPSVLFRKEEMLDETFIDLLSAERISRIVLVPSLLANIVAVARQKGTDSLPYLQYCTCSGEELRTDLAKAFIRLFPKKRLLNIYGSTEVTADVTCFEITGDTAWEGNSVPIGRPISNVRIYILDAARNTVPVGVPGEIYVTGAAVSKGYWNNEQLTEDKFIHHGRFPGEILFRTGDAGKWTEEGQIIYCGRIDNQLKVRGYRIEPAEVERILLMQEGVEQAVVTIKEGTDGVGALVAYIVSNIAISRAYLHRQLALVLPAYMLPAAIVNLENLPLTSSGKIDRNRLPAPDWAADGEDGFTAAASDLENEVEKIWQEVLKTTDPISIHNSFFNIGGHSLRLMQLINRYDNAFGVRLSVEELFRHTTIAAHAGLLANNNGDMYASIPAIAVAADYPVSDGQQRMYMQSHLGNSSRTYHLEGRYELGDIFDSNALEQAIKRVIDRHEILRTIFRVNESGELRQVVLPAIEFSLAYETMPAERVNDHLAVLMAKPFQLHEGPLLRAGVISSGAEVNIFWFCLHHIIGDGWSSEILAKEVMSYYEAIREGREMELVPLRIQYKDYAVWLKRLLESETVLAHRTYWMQELAGELPVLRLPMAGTRPAIQTDNGHCLTILLEDNLTDQLQTCCNDVNATLYMGFVAVLNALLYRYSGQSDIIIGSPVAGRAHKELEDQIGFYINTLVLRTSISATDNFKDLLLQIRRISLSAFSHQLYPFDRLIEDLQLVRDKSRSPLFDVMLTMQNQRDQVYEANDLLPGRVTDGGDFKVKYDLLFNIEKVSGGVRLDLRYNSDIYDKDSMIRMLYHFRAILANLVSDTNKSLSAVQYLTPAEYDELIAFGRSNVDVPAGTTFTGLFEGMVKAYPEAAAVHYGGETWSYQQLDEKANQIAQYLISQGVVKGSKVLLCMDPSGYAIASLLGILKAGGCYVPIDPTYPVSRIRHILADCSADILITDSDVAKSLPADVGRIIVADVLEGDGGSPSVSVSASDLLYVIYTSGSTGRPKGVQITHGNMADYLYGLESRIGISSCRSHALVSGLFTDLGNTVVYGSLAFGGSLHLFSREVLSSGDLLGQAIKEIDCVKITPSHWKALSAGRELVLPKGLLIFGGEALSGSIPAQISGCKVVNHYGPTETTVGKLLHEASSGEDVGGVVPVGRPFGN
uniref:amino acid adenylation domain-containing protein n=1 Tax=Chitinophaga sp. TaxID=1869181 RepID=UPI0031E14045